MRSEYTLVKDIISGHNERMNNIKKYYPFFRISDISFQGFRDEISEKLDMGYILMAVLRFFIEENNFNEKNVTYDDYQEFMRDIYRRDFEINLDKDEEKELNQYIFDKIRNDGKPFSYTYFDPESKKRKTIRTRLIESKIAGNDIVYQISADAISFYLDTKEIKDESNITIAQVLLGKMIHTRNFKGGTEIILRINNEVGRLIAKQKEILSLMSYDVFHGVQMYEDFMEHTVKWFDEEQKLFKKNKELVDAALRNCDNDKSYYAAMDDIFKLESELNRAMLRHSELLSACVSLQNRVDDMIRKNKLSRIRMSFDFRKVMATMIQKDDITVLKSLAEPLFQLGVKKTFSLSLLDNMLNYKNDGEEENEKIKSAREDRDFKYPDELEDERIRHNYYIFLRIFFQCLEQQQEFYLTDFNQRLTELLGERVLEHGDYFSFLTHLSQRESYNLKQIRQKPDTFLEGIMRDYLEKTADVPIATETFELFFEDNIVELGENNITNILVRNGGNNQNGR